MVDLDQLSGEEAEFVTNFLDHLFAHGAVCCADFPEMDPDRFEELAEAIVDFVNHQVRH